MSLFDKWFEKKAQKLGYSKVEDLDNIKEQTEKIQDEISNLIPTARKEVEAEYNNLFNKVENDAKVHARISIEKTLAKIKIENNQFVKRSLDPIKKEVKDTTVKLSEVSTRQDNLESYVAKNFNSLNAQDKELQKLFEADKKSITILNKKIEKPFYINEHPFSFNKKNTLYANDIQLSETNGFTISYMLAIFDKKMEYIFSSIDELMNRQELTEEETKILDNIKAEIQELQAFKSNISDTVDRLAHPRIRRRFTQRSLEEIQQALKKEKPSPEESQ